jgi:hypothetical protein
MRDASLFTPDRTWTAAESNMADVLLAYIREHPTASDGEAFRDFVRLHPEVDAERAHAVWAKLSTFPHMFEVAAARNTLAQYDLLGNLRSAPVRPLTQLSYSGWTVPLADLTAFLDAARMTPGVCELLAHVFRLRLPTEVSLRPSHVLQSQKIARQVSHHGARPRSDVYPYRSKSKSWAMFVLHYDGELPTLTAILPTDYVPAAFDWAIRFMRASFAATNVTSVSWPSDLGHDVFPVPWTRSGALRRRSPVGRCL